MPSLAKIWVISFMKAMLMSRWAFSMTLAASAVLIDLGAEDAARGDPAVDGGDALGHLGRSRPTPP